MVFPLHSVLGPGSKRLFNDGIQPISNRLKNQQAVTTARRQQRVRRGRSGPLDQLRLPGMRFKIVVYVEILVTINYKPWIPTLRRRLRRSAPKRSALKGAAHR